MTLIGSYFLANFTLPEEGEESVFKEIVFTDLQREEAAKVVAEYNKVSATTIVSSIYV